MRAMGTEELYTKQPVIVKHGEDHAGSTATFFGRWVTARGLVGPWSLPAHFTICAAQSSAPENALRSMRVPELEMRRRSDRKAA